MDQLIENGTFIKIDIQSDGLKDVELFQNKYGNIVEYENKYKRYTYTKYIKFDNKSKSIYYCLCFGKGEIKFIYDKKTWVQAPPVAPAEQVNL